jgi:hypothetical protein
MTTETDQPTIMVQATQLRADIAVAVASGLNWYSPRTGHGPSPDAWRGADVTPLAEHLALHIAAGIAPTVDRHIARSVLGTLAELQRPRDRYMRPSDPAEEQRLYWVPDQAAVAKAAERLRHYPLDAILAYVPLVMPGKVPGEWEHGQEVITVRPAVFLGECGGPCSSGLPSAEEARDAALAAARAALGTECGTVAYAVVNRSGAAEVFEV